MADYIEIIDKEGDVILVVGSSERNKKLKVSSITLSKASPVFNALFGPHFSQGRSARTSETPVEIALPDDDCFAMMRLCDLLHFREVPEFMCSPGTTFREQFLKFAIAVDKYDLVGKLHLQSQGMLLGWLKSLPSTFKSDFACFGNTLAASFLLNSPRAFEEASLRFINRG